MSNNRFSCLKPPNDDNDSSNEVGNKFKRPQRNSRFPSPERNSRFPRPERSPERNSRFPRLERSPERNSRFQRPERNSNTFTQPKRDDKPRHSRGGFGKFTYNHGRRSNGPSVFDNVKKDSQGRPMLLNATTSAFNINTVLKKIDKPKKERKKKKKKKTSLFEEEEKIKEEKTEEEKTTEREWNKQMLLNMQYEMETDSESGEEEV